MEKTFKNKNFNMIVKSNMLKSNELYFGEKDVQAEFEKVIRELIYHAPDLSRENMLIAIWRNLAKIGIKPLSITDNELTYRGVNMSNIGDKQSRLE